METLCLDCRNNYTDHLGGVCNECLGETGNDKGVTALSEKRYSVIQSTDWNENVTYTVYDNQRKITLRLKFSNREDAEDCANEWNEANERNK